MSLWSRVLGRVEARIDRHDFDTWFRPTFELDSNEREILVQVPNSRFAAWIPETFGALLDEALQLEEAAGRRLRFVPRVEDSRAATADDSPSPVARAASPLATLNPRYTFDSFVVGSSNQFAHAAARAVAEAPSKAYNPLFVYGGVGLGKTHILHAIGNAVAAANPAFSIVYLSAERFTNEVITSIRNKRTEEFRSRYRSVDLLLVDDIQFLAGKEATQEEFFHTFNALQEAEKQIVISSDKSPKELKTLEERLRSRFEWGLIADIQPPDLETRVAILRKKADLDRILLPDDVANFIAGKVPSNIRELEGLLTRVAAWASLTGNPIQIDLAREALRDILKDDSRLVVPADIVKAVAQHYGLKLSEIKSKSNMKSIAFPRQVAMYLLKSLTHLSFPEIGRLFGDKHHSTVIYSVDKIARLRTEDPSLDKVLNNLSAPFK